MFVLFFLIAIYLSGSLKKLLSQVYIAMSSLKRIVNEYQLPLMKLFAVNNNYLLLIKIFTVNIIIYR